MPISFTVKPKPPTIQCTVVTNQTHNLRSHLPMFTEVAHHRAYKVSSPTSPAASMQCETVANMVALLLRGKEIGCHAIYINVHACSQKWHTVGHTKCRVQYHPQPVCNVKVMHWNICKCIHLHCTPHTCDGLRNTLYQPAIHILLCIVTI